MAKNTNYPYDPFTGEVPMEAVENAMTVGSIVKDVASPINWLIWNYQYNPNMYSVTRGLKMPFGAHVARYGLANTIAGPAGIKNVWQGARKSGLFSTTGAIKETFRQSIGGKFYFGERFLKETGQYVHAQKAFKDKLEDTILHRVSKTAGITGTQSKRVSTVISREIYEHLDNSNNLQNLSAKALKEKIKGLGTAGFLKEVGLTKSQWEQISGKMPYLMDTRKLINKTGVKFGGTGSGNLKNIGRYAFKGTMFAAKSFALVGLVSTMWDLTRMVGEPIGRYIVENANRVGLAYQNRFMPETGGRIAMSYMTTGAATERQRAIEAISRSYINGRSAIGQEAQFLHG